MRPSSEEQQKMILKHLMFLNHSTYWFQVFKPEINGVKQKGVLENTFCSKEQVLELCKKHYNKGLCCVAINERPEGKTLEKDVPRITTLVIDIDVHKSRKVECVSTPADNVHAQKVGDDVKIYLESKGYVVGLIINSGNGCQVYLKVDVDVSTEQLLSSFKSRAMMFETDLKQFNDGIVCIDCITKDGNRRIKLAGTINKKDLSQKEDRFAHITYEHLDDVAEDNTKMFNSVDGSNDSNGGNAPQTAFAFSELPKEDTSRSAKEYNKVLTLIDGGYSKDEIFKEMNVYGKWSEEGDHYRNRTYNKALEFITSTHEGNGNNGSNTLKCVFYTKHLPLFDDLCSISGLMGREYDLILKGVYYHIVAALITPVFNKIRIGKLCVDPRIHLLVVVPSGQGKKNIKTTIINILKELNFKGHVPTSLNPEQLIGKVINRGTIKKPEWIQNEGYFSRDYIIFDEMNNLLTSKDPNTNESRKNLRISKDCIGENLVEKKSVDNTFDENECISYYPRLSVCGFTQPKTLPTDIVEEGDLRRDVVLYSPKISNRDKKKDYVNRLTCEDTSEFDTTLFVNFCKSVQEHLTGAEFTFTPCAVTKLTDLHSVLVDYGLSYSDKCRNFTKMVDWSLQDIFVKMCLVVGVTHGVKEINKEVVELAFMDLVEFYLSQLVFVESKVLGKLDYGEGWNGSRGKDQSCLERLFESGAVSEDTAISGEEFREEICVIKGVKSDMAVKHLQRYRKNNWIELKQEYQRSKVWLKFTPTTTNVDKNLANKCIEAYKQIVNHQKTSGSTLLPLPTLLPCVEEEVVDSRVFLTQLDQTWWHDCAECRSTQGCKFKGDDSRYYCEGCSKDKTTFMVKQLTEEQNG
jgi:hypothetical protein